VIPLHYFVISAALAIPAAVAFGRWVERKQPERDSRAYAEAQRLHRQRRLMASALHPPPAESEQLH
jgi:hypothetical protein